MKAFSEILPQTLRSIGMQKRFSAEAAIFHWREIIGEEIYSHARPTKLSHGILSVTVNNSVWAHHLITMKQDIMNKINNFIGDKVIKDIIFKAGYLNSDQNYENKEIYEDNRIRLNQVIVEEYEINNINNITASIGNEQLKIKLRRIMVKQAALKKVRKKLAWHNCRSCGILCSPDQDLCTVCGINQKAQNREIIIKILKQAPWLSYQEIKNYADCHLTDYNTMKNRLIDETVKELEEDKENNLKPAFLTMLINNIEPQAVSNEMIQQTLKRIRGKKNVFTFRR